MARERVAGEWPPVSAEVRPVGYVEDDPGEGQADGARRACRGVIELSELLPSGRRRWRNYGLHEVSITLVGGQSIQVKDCNFSFAKIRIYGAGAVEFRDCNLTKARWRSINGATVTMVGCNTYLGQGD